MQLALETSTNICSVAFLDKTGKLHEKRTEVRGSHSEQLFLFIEELMQEQGFAIEDLDSVVVSQGPGSYTGLRISASAVKGLLFRAKVPLFAANTLASFAASVVSHQSDVAVIHGIIDARRVHVYHQEFNCESGKITSKGTVEVIPIDEFEEMVSPGCAVIGTGIQRIDQKVLEKATVFDTSHITARSLLTLYEMDVQRNFIGEVDPQQFEPKYYTSKQF